MKSTLSTTNEKPRSSQQVFAGDTTRALQGCGSCLVRLVSTLSWREWWCGRQSDGAPWTNSRGRTDGMRRDRASTLVRPNRSWDQPPCLRCAGRRRSAQSPSPSQRCERIASSPPPRVWRTSHRCGCLLCSAARRRMRSRAARRRRGGAAQGMD
jgi:hypothetical protein